MNTNALRTALLPSIVAVAVLGFLSLGLISAELLVGGATVLALVGIASLEYRLNWKKLLR